ncbi:GNAT family N-acetyltransferase [Bacillus cereus]|uniref:GNAT family N-acetyltransferase n=1 Tax=Bacillus paramycoides TaxID=2026194 RepID=UPI000BF55409|nr:GNAT family N-acetyltransferase [Bacillus paramycoides]PFD41989.1 GNAT family N-acetyltransferase [Bacillus cereus]PGM60109.1 GNAT family N-acetyltransferase [Bacillus cereus]
MDIKIRAYKKDDEIGWVRCRALSFLDTAYYDNVFREKEKYENPAIELVAVHKNQIVGLIDIEYELEERTVCSRGTGLGGMIWHIAVHPDFRRRRIGNQLLYEAEKLAKKLNLNRLEAWTRDDLWVQQWYGNNDFVNVDSYLHVYSDHTDEIKDVINSNIKQLYPVQTFAHYTGENKEEIRKQLKRVHDCVCFEKYFS